MQSKKTKRGVDISSTYGMKEKNSETLWLVVADRSRARYFEVTQAEPKLNLLHDVSFPEGRMKGRDLVTDRPGRSFASWSQSKGGHQTGAPRHAMDSEISPSERTREEMGEKVAEQLERGRTRNEYDSLVLVMEPQLLGRVRTRLSSSTAARIIQEHGKDYAWMKDAELESRLVELVPKLKAKKARGVIPKL